MKKRQVLARIVLLVVCMLLVSIHAAAAAEAPMEAVAEEMEDGKLTVRLVSREDFAYFSMQVRPDFSRLPAGVTLTGAEAGKDMEESGGYDADRCAAVYQPASDMHGAAWAYAKDFEKETQVPRGSEFAVYTFDVREAAAGTQTITFVWEAAADINGDDLPWGHGDTVTTVRFTKEGDAAAHPDDAIGAAETVHFETNADLTVADVTVGQGERASLPEPEREGYIFEGWYTDEGLTQAVAGTFYEPRGDVTLYAKWKPVSETEYVVKFDVDGGERLTPISTEKGSQASLPVPEKEGYQFEGWYKDEARTEAVEEDYVPTEDTTLFAKWSQAGDDIQGPGFPVVPVVIAAAVVITAAVAAAIFAARRKRQR